MIPFLLKLARKYLKMPTTLHLLSLTNTLSGRKEVFSPIEPGRVRLYVCGITPYDYAHIGHGRCYVTFDVLYRLLTFLGYEVSYCRNFTDIDDKLLNRARCEYGDESKYKEVAQKYITAYEEDMQALGCLSPTYEPHVTNTIPQIIAFIEGLITTGHAYVVEGDVYYSIETFSSYGKLSKRNIDEMIAGARVVVNDKKRNPLDFALWKGEAEGSFWKSPWGYGRPGWHIECSAMARTYLGDQLDIHGGGMDLIFPHHENEIAQSEGLFNETFVRYWVHNAFVRINQEKMSKSLHNFLTLKDLFTRFKPEVARYLFLQHHYRSPLDFALDELPSIEKSYQRLQKLFQDTPLSHEKIPFDALSPIAQRMVTFLCDDLNTPGMLGVVFEHSKEIQEDSLVREHVYYVLKQIAGCALSPLENKVQEITPHMQLLIQEREEARKRKDWVTADALRDQLKALGFDVQDKKL